MSHLRDGLILTSYGFMVLSSPYFEKLIGKPIILLSYIYICNQIGSYNFPRFCRTRFGEKERVIFNPSLFLISFIVDLGGDQ